MRVMVAPAATHLCPGCGEERPIENFAVQENKGWRDPNGIKHRYACRECERTRSRGRYRREVYGDGYGYLPVEPFREWLEKKLLAFKADPRHDQRTKQLINGRIWFADYVGLSDRRLYDIMQGRTRRVRLDVVDRALVHEGSTGLWELYPHLYDEEAV